MPILNREPDLFPDDLLDPENIEAATQQPWWALYTLSNREKDLVRRLRALGVAHYCPVIEKTTRSPSGRRRKSWVPLFSNYVFMSGTEEQRYAAKTTNCVSRDLEVVDCERLVADLVTIRALIETGTPVLPEAKLQPGTPVRIRSGSMAGAEGVVVKRRGQQRLVVSVNFLQRGASVLLDHFEVEQL